MRADRFRPTRAGIIGLYQYADQIFCFEEGRLALRGRNTSGKSKVLELVVPFVLDGDISPRKLDPFAKDARDMHWNLIGATDKFPDARSDQRFGYAWLEFWHPDRDEWLTAIIGLKANRADSAVKRRYFVTDQRVGINLMLCEHAAGRVTPVGLDTAITRIAADGEIFSKQAAYKTCLRERLVGFDSAETYEEMLRLIRQLRQPKLSKELKADTVSTMLNGTLPGIDEAQVRKLSDGLEGLEELRRKRAALTTARGLAHSIDEHAYRRYACAAVAHRAGSLRHAEQAFETASGALGRHETAIDEARSAAQEAEREVTDAELIHRRVQRRLEALLASPEVQDASRIVELGEAVDAAQIDVQTASDEVQTAQTAALEAAASVAEAEDALGQVTTALRLLTGKLEAACTDAAVPADDVSLVASLLDGREALIRQMRRLLGDERDADAEQRRRADAETDAAAEHDDALAGAEAAEQALTAARSLLREQTAAWLADLDVLTPDADGAQALIDDPESQRDRVDGWWRAADAQVTASRAGIAERRRVLQERHAELEETIAQLREHRQDEPPIRQTDRAERAGRPGAPLWRLVDFAEHVKSEDRAALEAALAEAGLLDAWVAPDGTVAREDTALVAGVLADGPTLADLLIADPHAEAVDRDLVGTLLSCVALEGAISVGVGRFQAGVLHGRATKAEPEYIGAQARQTRRRRRIAEAEVERDAIAGQLDDLAAQDDVLAARAQAAEDERRALPGTDGVQAADRAHTKALQAVEATDRRLAQARGEQRRADQALAAARRAVAEHEERHGIPGRPAALSALDAHIEVARALLNKHAVETVRSQERDRVLQATRRAHAGQAATLHAAERRSVGRARALADVQGALQAAEMRLGRSSSEVLEQVRLERREVERLDREAKTARDRHGTAREAFARLDAATGGLSASRDAAGQARRDAVDGIRALGHLRLFTAAAPIDQALIDDEASAGGWTLTVALERIRALPESFSTQVSDRRLEQLTNEVGTRIDTLARELASHGMQATSRHHLGLMVCEVTWRGTDVPLRTLNTKVDEELVHHTRLLSEETNRVLGQSVLGELAEHLRGRVGAVRRSLAGRNAALRKCPTGGGRTLELKWTVADLGDHDVRAVKLLSERSVMAIPEEDRQLVFDFIVRRLQRATETLEDETDADRRRGGVAQALDYRTWFTFELYVRDLDGSVERLTGRKHGEGSGGEQSTLMNVALFASAAAMYDLVPHAPRLIALDEAMDGIDEGVRRNVLGALVDLELDFVATSFDLDPCVQEVPAVGFYELHRDNAEWGVFAQHFIWNGSDMVEVVDETAA